MSNQIITSFVPVPGMNVFIHAGGLGNLECKVIYTSPKRKQILVKMLHGNKWEYTFTMRKDGVYRQLGYLHETLYLGLN